MSPDSNDKAATPATTSLRREAKRENIFASLVFNILLPGLVLSKLSSPDRLGPVLALVVGLAFPLGYGLRDLVKRGKWNFISLVGLASTGLTGGFALFELDGFWFAVKEAAVPLLFGVAVLATASSERPLVRLFVLNESVVDVPLLEERLNERGLRREFDALLRSATQWMAGGFLLSAILNYGLARVVLLSPAGTPEFTAELGRMTWLSWPVIALPSMLLTSLILWRLLAGIQALTGLELEELLHAHKTEEAH